MVQTDEVHNADQVIAALVEVVHALTGQYLSSAMQGEPAPEWLERCIGLLKGVFEVMLPDVPWEEIVLAGHQVLGQH